MVCVWPMIGHGQVSPAMCGPLDNAFGPFDYRSDHYQPSPGDLQSHKEKLRLVESVHFPPNVEMLLGGSARGAGTLWGDLDYVLRAFPNHHRALAASLKWWERNKISMPTGMDRPIECVFERAVRFRPEDTVSRLLYATFLLRNDRRAEAMSHIDAAKGFAGESAFAHYNVGMVYADAGAFDQALEQAHRAKALGLPHTGLADRLKAAGRWQEPLESMPAASKGVSSRADEKAVARP